VGRAPAFHGVGGLVVIGDRKHVMPSFATPNVRAYRTDGATASGEHMLDTNWRSEPEVLDSMATKLRGAALGHPRASCVRQGGPRVPVFSPGRWPWGTGLEPAVSSWIHRFDSRGGLSGLDDLAASLSVGERPVCPALPLRVLGGALRRWSGFRV